MRLRKDSLDLYDSFSHVPHLGFVIPNVTEKKLAGKFECLFSSNHYFEQSRAINLFVEPPLKVQRIDGVTTVGYGGYYDGEEVDGINNSMDGKYETPGIISLLLIPLLLNIL